MKKWLQFLYLHTEKIVNNRITSKFLQQFVKSSWSKRWIPWFVSHFQVDLSENVKSLEEFCSLEDFFIRKIHWQKRYIDPDKEVVVSPVDGFLTLVDNIDMHMNFKVKGKEYSLEDLFQCSKTAQKYIGGTIFILYLSPKNYHRFHSPTDVVETNCHFLGGHSYPVNDFGLKYGKKTLTGNYRMIQSLLFKSGECSLIAVGAQNVNSIVKTAKKKNFARMEEIGYFSFGSTVLLLFEKNSIQILHKESRIISAGEEIARISIKDLTHK